MRPFALIALILFAGCQSSKTTVFSLDEEWAPLVDIRQKPGVLRNVGSKTAIVTIGKHCFVRDLEDWLETYKPGSPVFRGIMRHEQIHAKRQRKYGIYRWIIRYLYDKRFALQEEKIGFYHEMMERRAIGSDMIPEAVASDLSQYKNLSGRLTSYDSALNWVKEALAGRWKPPAD